ncbi:eukaryotic translation initiation factor 2 subunit beta-like [Carex rostrata]
MRRQPEHLMAFLLTELGTSGSLDGRQRLVVKGRFPSKNFGSILRKYRRKMNKSLLISEAAFTIFSERYQITFSSTIMQRLCISCKISQCGSSRTVMPIEAGFVARVGPRKN